MPIDLPTDTPIPEAATGAIVAAKKPLTEKMLKSKLQPADDPTDDDIDFVYELCKESIKAGNPVSELDWKVLIPYFQQASKQRAAKYRNSRIMDFFTGSTFLMLVYLILDKVVM